MVDTWATVADVLKFTGKTVGEDKVTMAQANIDLVAGRLPADAERIGDRDQHWLKLAVAYQAAWLTAQPDVFERLDVRSTGQSSASGEEGWLQLAPFAKWALKRVSWLGSRSLRVKAPYEGSDAQRVVYGDDNDPGTWVPIGG
ncbi:hypothetical protein ACFWMR_01900 [Amycolatopsis thailandensis]|uniref:hypothetical protein n=1 Tax=Amycolatopsis thailandensis TaxID=589330 RepID=UPI00365291DB